MTNALGKLADIVFDVVFIACSFFRSVSPALITASPLCSCSRSV